MKLNNPTNTFSERAAKDTWKMEIESTTRFNWTERFIWLIMIIVGLVELLS